MPNHVSTVCVVTGPEAEVNAFVKAHIVVDPKEGGGAQFDLGTVVPKPAIVSETESGSEADAGFFALTGLHEVKFAMFCETPMHSYARHGDFEMNQLTTVDQFREWLEKKNPRAIEKGRKSLQCFRETGHLNWHSWSIAHWGTKWGAYDYEERLREPGKFIFKFETAWSVPTPIFEALGALYDGLTFATESIDEGGGPEFVGNYTNKSESFVEVEPDRERHRRVYGKYPDPPEEEDEEEAAETS